MDTPANRREAARASRARRRVALVLWSAIIIGAWAMMVALTN